MTAVVPGNFSSTIDTGLPQSPRSTEPPEVVDDLENLFAATQTLQMALETALADIVTLKARLTAAGIP